MSDRAKVSKIGGPVERSSGQADEICMKMDFDIPNIHLLFFTISIFSLMKANKYFEYPSSRSVLSEASTVTVEYERKETVVHFDRVNNCPGVADRAARWGQVRVPEERRDPRPG